MKLFIIVVHILFTLYLLHPAHNLTFSHAACLEQWWLALAQLVVLGSETCWCHYVAVLQRNSLSKDLYPGNTHMLMQLNNDMRYSVCGLCQAKLLS